MKGFEGDTLMGRYFGDNILWCWVVADFSAKFSGGIVSCGRFLEKAFKL